VSNRLTPGKSSSGRVKILDFGLAKLWSADPEISNTGMVIGTPRYMAPEQVAGDAVDPRTDLFSLGCVLYRMATGRAPFGGSDLLSVLRAMACEEPAPVRTLNPQVPVALSDLIGQLMSKSPDGRPASAEVVVQRLQLIADDLAAGRGVAEPATGPVEWEPAGQRGRGVGWLVGAMIGLVVLLPLAYLFGAQLIRIATNQGQVVIQIDDPQVEVTIQENRVAILDRAGQREITLTAGEHQLEVTVKESTGEKTFTTDRFTLSRGGRKVIDVRAELSKALAARAAAPLDPPGRAADLSNPPVIVAGPAEAVQAVRFSGGTDLDRRAAHWVLSLGGSVTVLGRHEAKPIEVPAGTALPVGDFELTKINLNARPVNDAGLDELTGLKNLDELVLSGTQITNAGLAHVAGLTQLKSLTLDRTRVTDAGLAHLKGLTKLASLSLGLTSVTDAGLDQLQGLPALTELALHSTRVADAGLKNLSALKHLKSLNLNSSRITDSGLAPLEGLSELTTLHLRRTLVTDAGLKHLQPLTKLEALNLGHLPLTDTGLAQLLGLKRLQYFDVEDTRLTDAGLSNLQTLKDLKGLSLNHTRVTDAGLVYLEPLTKLTILNLGQTQVTEAGLAHLRGLKNLSDLRLEGARQVGDFAIPELLHLPCLRRIDLSDTHVSAKGLAILKGSLPNGAHIVWSEPNDTAARAILAAGGHVEVRVSGAGKDYLAKTASDLPSDSFQITGVSLAGLRQPLKELLDALKNPGVDALGSLDLSDTTVGDADLPSLQGLTHLRRLVLDGTNIEGQGLVHLQELPELKELGLGCPKLTELFVVELTGLKKLETLSLAKSPISDEGARHLAQLKQLKELDLSNTHVTAARVAELKKSLPQCRIITTASAH
jgi:Leucine-rich repeat (LRR) protein